MKKRILAMILSITMGISAFPVAASETFESEFQDSAAVLQQEPVDGGIQTADLEQGEFVQEEGQQQEETEEGAAWTEELPEVSDIPLEEDGLEIEEILESETTEEPEFQEADPTVAEETEEEEIELSDSELFSDAALVEEAEEEDSEDSPFDTEDTDIASTAETAYAGLIQVQPEDWIQNADGSFSLQKKKLRISSDNETAMMENTDAASVQEQASEIEGYEEEMQQEPAVVVNEAAQAFSDNYTEEELVLIVEGETSQPVEGETSQPLEELAKEAALDNAPMQNEAAEYYTAADGLLKIQTGTNEPGYYYFDAKGHLYTGRVAVKSGTLGFAYGKDSSYFFMDLKTLEKTKATPADSSLGQLQRNFWYWNGKNFQYFEGGYGRLMPVAEYIQKITNYQGYIKIKDKYYALKTNGVPKVGFQKLQNGYYYYFSKNGTIPGEMVRQSWITEKDSKGRTWWRYFQKNGQRKILGNGSQYVIARLDNKIDSSIKKNAPYVLDKNGYLNTKNTLRKARFTNGVEYYCYADSTGALVKKSLVKYNGYLYYIGSGYKMVRNKILTIGGKTYYFAKSGKTPWKNCWHRIPVAENRYYYFGSDYAIVKKTGWQRIIDNGVVKGWFYFHSSGKHYMNKLVTTNKGSKYYFKTTGAAATGFVNYQGILYYFRPSTSVNPYSYAMSGIIRDSKNLVLAYGEPKTKEIIKGWKYLGSYWYYFDSNGRAVRNASMKKGNSWGYLDSYGHWITGGWVIEKQGDGSEKRYYVDPSNGVFYKNCWKNIDGLNYYFTADGSIHTKLDRMPGANFGTCNLSVNREKSQMTAYSADWKTPLRVFAVSVGKDETPTPQGTFRITNTGQRWTPLMGPSYGQWASHFYGGCYIHSIPYTYMNTYTMDRTGFCLLGSKQSHGCIRMRASDVYWTYMKCGGATIRIYDTEPLPLGPGKTWWIPEGQFYDPTDWTVPENNLSGPLWD